MSMSIPADLAAALQGEQRRHLAGELGESPEAVAERRRIVCGLAFANTCSTFTRSSARDGDAWALTGRPG